MLRILDESEGSLVATKVTGKLTTADYHRLVPLLNDRLDKFEKISWYYEMEDFEGWEAEALWKEIRFDLKHANDFTRIAMVGDQKWEKWMTNLMKPFTSAEVKYFDLSHRKEAVNWIRGRAVER